MPTYISLISWTDQGIRSAKQTTERASAAADLAGRMGGEMKDIFWTVGAYDLVAISEFPDDETATAYLLNIGAQGNVRTTTLRAYNADEMSGILAKVEG
jgi:uncharacterized protein with GYD domain